MKLTEQELIEEFERRDIALNKRVLTDWRAKGYLPRLQTKGLGKGRGKLYFWTDPTVIERALLVDEALQADHRGAKIPFILWLFGYQIHSPLIRAHLLTGVERFKKMAVGEREGWGVVEDHVEDIVSKYYYAARKYPHLGLRQDLPPTVLEMIINVFINSAYDLNDVPFEEGVEAAINVGPEFSAQNDTQPVSIDPSERRNSAKQIWKFVHEHFSLAPVQAALREATENDLLRTQADIGTIFRLVRGKLMEKPEVNSLREMRIWAAYLIGTLLSIVDIAMRHQGFGAVIDQHISRLSLGDNLVGDS